MTKQLPDDRVVCILGSDTPLGEAIADHCADIEMESVGIPSKELNLANLNALQEQLPDRSRAVIHCSFMDDIEQAESDRETAFRINSEGARIVARACKIRKFYLLHIGTDQVFDGRKREPYTERDLPCPVNVYGASKMAGEKTVRAEGGRYLIVRTQDVFGGQRDNYILRMIHTLEQERGSINVLKDRVTCPTFTRHLATGLIRLLQLGKTGIVHVSAEGQCSEKELVRRLAARIYPRIEINEVYDLRAGLKAHHPGYTVLSKRRYRSWTGELMPHWQDGLYEYLKEIGFFRVQPVPDDVYPDGKQIKG